jgi:hypothetical protein
MCILNLILLIILLCFWTLTIVMSKNTIIVLIFHCHKLLHLILLLWLYSALLDLGRFFRFLILHTVGRTPCTSDQPVARPLPTQRTTQTRNKHTHNTDIHALSMIRTHDPSVRASEDSSCLKPRCYCDRQILFNIMKLIKSTMR